jgi:hypothetical protein
MFTRSLRLAAAMLLVFVVASSVVVWAQAPLTFNATVQLWNTTPPSGSCAGYQMVQDSTAIWWVCSGGLTSTNGTWQKMVTTAVTTGAGFFGYGQGTAQGHATANMIIEEAPAAVTAYEIKKPGTANNGIPVEVNTSNVIVEDFSGNTTYSTAAGGVTIGSGTSISSTSVCSTTSCPAGFYLVNVAVEITTACTTTGTYQVNLIYTDDTTVSKTVTFPLNGSGVTSSVLALSATTNFGEGSFVLRSKGTASINYSTTAGACGTGGPMVGKMSITVLPLST